MKFDLRSVMAAVLGGMFMASPMAHATITFTGGLADLTFYYDSVADRWDVVLQNKASTEATGNTNPYAGYPGIVGGSSSNVTFNTLQVNVTSSPLVGVNGTDYLVTPANGTAYMNGPGVNQPDLGIRTRLREDLGSGVVQQFDFMRLSLNAWASTKPAGSEFIMFKTDTITNATTVLYETAANDFTHDWGNYGHTHWHYGFSEVGDYALVFDIDGIGGLYGDSDTPSQVTVNFSVIPEPSTALLGMIALAVVGLRRKRA